MNPADLELRVLMGLQAGARMTLGDGRYALGSGESADVVLSGPRIEAEHAVLTIASGRATLAPSMGVVRKADGTEISDETDLRPGEAVECDGVWIAVAPPSAPWPEASEIVGRRFAAAAAAAPSAAAPAEAAQPRPAAAPAAAPTPAARPARTLPPVLVPIAAAALLLLISGAWLWSATRAVSAPPAAGEASAVAVERATPPAASVESRLASTGLADRVSARRTATGWTLAGIVSDDSERDRLRAAFADFSPPVALQVHTTDEIAATVSGIIARWGMPVKLELIGGGRARLTVAAPNTDTAERIAQAFREELAGARDIETEFITPASLIPSLQDLIDKAGLATRVRVAPAGPTSANIAAQGALGASELERWNAVLAEFVRKHGEFVKVQSAITRLSPAMPFKIRAVIDGATPQVFTADGQRILEGGSLYGYRLVAVREKELVFNGPERVSIARPGTEGTRAAVPR